MLDIYTEDIHTEDRDRKREREREKERHTHNTARYTVANHINLYRANWTL